MGFVGAIDQKCVKMLVRASLYTSMFYVVTQKSCFLKGVLTLSKPIWNAQKITNFIPFSQLTEAF